MYDKKQTRARPSQGGSFLPTVVPTAKQLASGTQLLDADRSIFPAVGGSPSPQTPPQPDSLNPRGIRLTEVAKAGTWRLLAGKRIEDKYGHTFIIAEIKTRAEWKSQGHLSNSVGTQAGFVARSTFGDFYSVDYFAEILD